MINTVSPDFVKNPLLDLRIVSGRDLTEFSQADQAEIKRCLDLSSMAYAEIEKDKKINEDEKKDEDKGNDEHEKNGCYFYQDFLR